MKSKNRKKKIVIKKVLSALFFAVVIFILLTTVITMVSLKANIKKAKSFESVIYENQLKPQYDNDGYYTFTTDKDFKIVQLTDVHIGGGWMSIRKDAQAINAVATMLTEEKPDLVIVTGDIAYPVPFQSGTFNNKSGAKVFAELMEQLGVYWTLTFGNHDGELYSYHGLDDISAFYRKYPHCIHQPGPEEVDGYSNQIINIKSSEGIITQSLFLLDSHSYTDDDKLGMKWHYDNIHENQIEWYKKSLAELNKENRELTGKKSSIKSLAFIHIPPMEMREAWNQYVANDYKDSENLKLIDGFAGGSGKMVYCSQVEDDFVETLISEGSTQGLFFGHDHRNSMSFEYNGIRLSYSMSIDYLAIPGIGKIGAQRGCTVINVTPDGGFNSKVENYYQDKYQSLYDKEDITMQTIIYTQPEER